MLGSVSRTFAELRCGREFDEILVCVIVYNLKGTRCSLVVLLLLFLQFEIESHQKSVCARLVCTQYYSWH